MAANVKSLATLISEGYSNFVLIDSTDDLVRRLRERYPTENIWRRDIEPGEELDYEYKGYGYIFIFPCDDPKYEKYLSSPHAYIIRPQEVTSNVHSV